MAGKYRKIYWTDHVKIKMRQYGLSKSKLLNLVYKPERTEQGIAPGTTAVMQSKKRYPWSKPAAQKRPPGEIWLMYQDENPSAGSGQAIRKIISCWRYPGITKPGESIPVPDDIRQELNL